MHITAAQDAARLIIYLEGGAADPIDERQLAQKILNHPDPQGYVRRLVASA